MSKDKELAFSGVLKNLMQEHGLTLKKLADKVGMSKQTISSYCLGNSRPSYELLIKLADYFGVTCDYLLTGVEPQDKKEHQDLGLSGDAIRLLKQCQDERVRELVNRLLGSPEFYQRAAENFNLLSMLNAVQFNDKNYFDFIFERLLEQNGGDNNKAEYDFEEFTIKDTRLVTNLVRGIMISVSRVYDVKITEATEEPQAAPASLGEAIKSILPLSAN
ncbi:MAG: helix-turn-helix domain-containing protein [Ruminococcus sp.]|nr:helix-turn-helix domain-containing protein [Alphaproteobacteria bacterium]MBQ8693378.1 helix-turn-helix domain-containing protein [Synergistaceae bacterium]MBR1602884.1 helix-turn-helix domain-containing protein [Synergistaceae bacterium]MBR1731572.1 helix-turn-helix domain-containing protein [Ruminococcus sp.]